MELAKCITTDEMLRKFGRFCCFPLKQYRNNKILQSFENCNAISKEWQDATKEVAGAMTSHLFVKARKDVRDKQREAKQFLESHAKEVAARSRESVAQAAARIKGAGRSTAGGVDLLPVMEALLYVVCK